MARKAKPDIIKTLVRPQDSDFDYPEPPATPEPKPIDYEDKIAALAAVKARLEAEVRAYDAKLVEPRARIRDLDQQMADLGKEARLARIDAFTQILVKNPELVNILTPRHRGNCKDDEREEEECPRCALLEAIHCNNWFMYCTPVLKLED